MPSLSRGPSSQLELHSEIPFGGKDICGTLFPIPLAFLVKLRDPTAFGFCGRKLFLQAKWKEAVRGILSVNTDCIDAFVATGWPAIGLFPFSPLPTVAKPLAYQENRSSRFGFLCVVFLSVSHEGFSH